jgi:hypothetical protein
MYGQCARAHVMTWRRVPGGSGGAEASLRAGVTRRGQGPVVGGQGRGGWKPRADDRAQEARRPGGQEARRPGGQEARPGGSGVRCRGPGGGSRAARGARNQNPSRRRSSLPRRPRSEDRTRKRPKVAAGRRSVAAACARQRHTHPQTSRAAHPHIRRALPPPAAVRRPQGLRHGRAPAPDGARSLPFTTRKPLFSGLRVHSEPPVTPSSANPRTAPRQARPSPTRAP